MVPVESYDLRFVNKRLLSGYRVNTCNISDHITGQTRIGTWFEGYTK